MLSVADNACANWHLRASVSLLWTWNNCFLLTLFKSFPPLPFQHPQSPCPGSGTHCLILTAPCGASDVLCSSLEVGTAGQGLGLGAFARLTQHNQVIRPGQGRLLRGRSCLTSLVSFSDKLVRERLWPLSNWTLAKVLTLFPTASSCRNWLLVAGLGEKPAGWPSCVPRTSSSAHRLGYASHRC